MKTGIVGLPNAGKSTLFNALTSAGIEAAAYPFTTIEPNQAIVPVPDLRLDRLAELTAAPRQVAATITFVDIAGLVRGAHKGEGLGNQFLGQIRESDAILHVVRSFAEPNVAHPHGAIDPADDIETIEAELNLADLELAERWCERLARQAKSGDKRLLAQLEWLKGVVELLGSGQPARTAPTPPAGTEPGELPPFITAKPTLFVANVSDELAGASPTEAAPAVADHAARAHAGVVVLSARLEAELNEFEGAEQAAMRGELGVEGESGLTRVIHGAYQLLDLITFFTAGPGAEAWARSLKRGSTAYEAAGRIHGDIQRGFVRAEVIAAEALLEAGSYGSARDRGQLRTEGRDYVVQDGDVITVKFTP